MINLVVVAHPDDEILGFGGSSAVLSASGEIIQPIILCGSVEARKNKPTYAQLSEDMINANKTVGNSMPILGDFPNIKMNIIPHIELVQFIEEQIYVYKPDRIFTHHPFDLNDDHRQVSNACAAAVRLFQRKNDIKPIKSFYFMEILSSTDWSFSIGNSNFSPNVFVEITSSIDKKISALECYRGVMRSPPHPRSHQVLRGHAAYRGGQSNYLYSEAFQLIYGLGF